MFGGGPTPFFSGLSILLFFVALGYLSWQGIIISEQHVVRPGAPRRPTQVIREESVMDTVRQLVRTGSGSEDPYAIGQRQVGTRGLVEAFDFLHNEMQKIEETVRRRPASGLQATLSVHNTTATGHVDLDFFKNQFSNAYHGQSFLALRIGPRDGANGTEGPKALMLASHYDSAWGSPGAADDALGSAIVLEIARLVADGSVRPPKSPIVFFLNGGEEPLMQGAHAFYTNHEWISEVGAVINLEATGSTGPAMLFQASGDWTAGLYARSAPFPAGSALAQDFFDAGLIPADTDFRIFSSRHLGHLPGIDLAMVGDASTYHTRNDVPQRILPGTAQQYAENILAATLAFTDKLHASAGTTLDPGPDSEIFFSEPISGAMVAYSRPFARILHAAPLVGAVILCPLLLSGLNRPVRAVLKAVAVISLSLTCALAGPVLFALAHVALVGRGMIWFARPYLIPFLFGPVALAGALLPWTLVPHLPATAISLAGALWAGTLGVVMTARGLGASFLFAPWSAALLLLSLVQHVLGWTSWPGHILALMLTMLPASVNLINCAAFVDHLSGKLSMSGHPATGLLGLALGDLVLALLCGLGCFTATLGLLPLLAKSFRGSGRTVVALLILASVSTSGMTRMLYRNSYDTDHLKRLLAMHLVKLDGPNATPVHAEWVLAIADPNPLSTIPLTGRQGHAPPFPEATPEETASLAAAAAAAAANEPQQDIDPRFRAVASRGVNAFDAIYPAGPLLQKSGRTIPAPRFPDGRPTPHLRFLGCTPSPRNPAAHIAEMSFEATPYTAILNLTRVGDPEAPAALRWSFRCGEESCLAPVTVPQGKARAIIARAVADYHTDRWPIFIEVPADATVRIEASFVRPVLGDQKKVFDDGLPDWVSLTLFNAFQAVYELRC